MMKPNSKIYHLNDMMDLIWSFLYRNVMDVMRTKQIFDIKQIFLAQEKLKDLGKLGNVRTMVERLVENK